MVIVVPGRGVTLRFRSHGAVGARSVVFLFAMLNLFFPFCEHSWIAHTVLPAMIAPVQESSAIKQGGMP